ncbi:hypothetical protein [Ensifer sp.]|uniref:hypothetical protein n=1 Tax=Ensifer sp. TaxID=1872086 RepID=UPI002896FF96|nr:hypothetical protein [Ensifer sp.]
MLEFQIGVVIALGWVPIVMPWLIHFKWRGVCFWTATLVMAVNAMLPLMFTRSSGDIAVEALAWLFYVITPTAILLFIGLMSCYARILVQRSKDTGDALHETVHRK